MPESSYSIYVANDGSGNFTPTTRRNPTAASGGTTLTLPTGENYPLTTTKLLYLAIDEGKRRILNDLITHPTASYSIDVVNDGSGNFTTTVRYNPTAPSGGTTLSLAAAEIFPGTSTKLFYLAIDAPKRRILNDKAAGN